MYDQYLHLSEVERNKVYEALQEEMVAESGFVCPRMNCSLYIPCGIKKCDYYVDNSWAQNCILFYVYNEGKTQLSPKEIAFLFQIPIEEVIEIYETQVKNIRKRFINKKLEKENKITLIENIPVCCVCNHKTNSTIQRDGWTYCGIHCLNEKPPYVFNIEKEFGSNIETILNVTLKEFKSSAIIEKILGIRRKKLEYLVYKYAPELFEHWLSISNQVELFGRRRKTSKICINALRRLHQTQRQFGAPEYSITDFRENVCALLKRS